MSEESKSLERLQFENAWIRDTLDVERFNIKGLQCELADINRELAETKAKLEAAEKELGEVKRTYIHDEFSIQDALAERDEMAAKLAKAVAALEDCLQMSPLDPFERGKMINDALREVRGGM